jgi:epoxyqueuosine reductase QueG
LEKCPAQAANGILWDIHTYRDNFFNAKKCKEYCEYISQKRINKKHLICGILYVHCPLGKKIEGN